LHTEKCIYIAKIEKKEKEKIEKIKKEKGKIKESTDTA